MGLDYTSGCVNFRDAGEFITFINGDEIIPHNKLYRGGSIDFVTDWNDIEKAKTIINLRNGRDDTLFNAAYYHFPMANKVEKYNTHLKEVRVWLNNIVKTFEDPKLEYPVLVHCLSGKDRTGIVIAALLLIAGVPKQTIIEEYLLSDGEVSKERILTSIEGFSNVKTYFNKVNVDLVKKNLVRG